MVVKFHFMCTLRWTPLRPDLDVCPIQSLVIDEQVKFSQNLPIIDVYFRELSSLQECYKSAYSIFLILANVGSHCVQRCGYYIPPKLTKVQKSSNVQIKNKPEIKHL